MILRFGLLAAALLTLMQLSKYTLFFQSGRNEVLVAGFALLFLAFGYYLSRLMVKPAPTPSGEPIVPKEAGESNRTALLEALGISKREYEVLQLLDRGLSNQEIARTLFISESTVKTHVSRLLSKLGARRRTEAVRLAREKGVLGE